MSIADNVVALVETIMSQREQNGSTDTSTQIPPYLREGITNAVAALATAQAGALSAEALRLEAEAKLVVATRSPEVVRAEREHALEVIRGGQQHAERLAEIEIRREAQQQQHNFERLTEDHQHMLAVREIEARHLLAQRRVTAWTYTALAVNSGLIALLVWLCAGR